tara:strand:+ start:1011 stop:2432 length:1422 start_codon:yes stop_codon:yes gene_type:complete
MNSIRNKLRLYISLSISVLTLTILIASDVSIDTWLDKEFDRSIINKAGLLITLISENTDEVEFEFADEFMPEFSGKDDPEYFQLWHDNKVFERSNTLHLFSIKDLPKIELSLNETSITNIILPDGRAGRLYFTKFIPQIDSDDREVHGLTKEDFSRVQKPMELAYAISTEKLDHVSWFVDIIFVLSSILSLLIVWLIVSKVVERGLLPLDKFNAELKNINIHSDSMIISSNNLPIELLPMAEGINHFLQENKLLYAREKRITSDIAHELKTPITELLNLAEVAIKFPNELQITDNFETEVLNISIRLKNIVNGILLLQKSTSKIKLEKLKINVSNMIQQILKRENTSEGEIIIDIQPEDATIFSSEIAIETILTNLINNALHYSPKDSPIGITIVAGVNSKSTISVSNLSIYQYSTSEIERFFEPLWQKDSARTSTEKFGLGLAIVKSYCDNINASISINLDTQGRIVFTIIL